MVELFKNSYTRIGTMIKVTNRQRANRLYQKYRTFMKIVLSMAGVMFLVQLFIQVSGFGYVEYVDLNDRVRTKVTTAAGDSQWCEDMRIPGLDAGDQIEFYISLPERPFDGQNALCFFQYHSEITVYAGEEILYTKGQDLTKQMKMYGNEFCAVPVSDRYWGQEIRVHVKQMEGSASNHFTYFRAMRWEDSRLYPIIGDRFAFVFFGLILFLSIWLFVIVGINRISQKSIPSAMLWISAFCFLTSVWQLSSRRLFYILIGYERICALSEYYCLYLAPVPLIIYLAQTKRKKKLRRIYYGTAGLFFVVFCAANLADLRWHIHLVRFESLMYVLFFVFACMLIWIEVFATSRLRDQKDIYIRGGILFAISLVPVQIFILVILDYVENDAVALVLQKMNLISGGIAVFIVSVIMSVNEMAIRMIRRNAAQEQLRIMALTDEQTELPNRRYCEARLGELRKNDRYSMVFLDVDGLKYMNDVYGHDMGDKLIRCTAEVIREAFRFENGFYGRWGGDEFLVVCGEEKEAKLFADNLQVLQEEFNRKGELPFDLSISCGIESNDPANGREAEEIRREADLKMYEQKKLRHRERDGRNTLV